MGGSDERDSAGAGVAAVALAPTLEAPVVDAAHAATMAAGAPTPELAEALATTLLPAEDLARGETLAAPLAAPPAAPRAPSPGALLVEAPGRYRRGAELGRGGMGRVVLAVDEHLGREVAIKEIHGAHDGVSIGALSRFLREARITGQLEHPNIVPVHELGRRADGSFYYTMKRIRGRSLAAALRDLPGVDERLKLLRHFRDVCEAVAYAHARGVVHRDLKPDNVMVGEFGETLVVDWGIAKVLGAAEAPGDPFEERLDAFRLADGPLTVAGHAIGTPAYMSPEQARGDLELIDERSDVWGLGAILFELLTGRPPFVAPTTLALLHAVLEEPVPRVLALAPGAPPELAAIVDRALCRERSERYGSAKELGDEIGSYQDGRRVRAYRYGAWERVRRFVRRNRAASIAAGSIFLAVTGAALFMTWSYRAERVARRAAETRALIAEAGRLDQLGHRPHAFALLRAASELGGADLEPALARAGLFAHAAEAQPIVMAGHAGLVHDARFAADGARLLTCSDDRTIREWDVATGALLRTIPHDRRIHVLEVFPDGAHWITTSDTDEAAHVALTVWDAARGVPERDVATGVFPESIALSPDGRRVAVGDRLGVARIFDLASGEGRVVAEHGGWVRALVFSPDGRELAVGGRGPRVQVVSDAGTRTLDGLEGEVRTLDWSGDGRIAAGRQDGSLVLARAADGVIERVVAAHGAPVTRARFSPDGTRVGTASEDASARLWSAASGALVFDLPHRGRVEALAFDPTGARVATAELDAHVADVWTLPVQSGLVLHGHEAWVHDAVFSPDGATIASASRDGTVRLWSAASGAEERVLRGHEGSVYVARYARGGSLLATGGRDGTVRLWRPSSGELIRTIAAHGDAVYDLVFLGETRIASISVDGSLRVSSVDDGSASWSHASSTPLDAIASHDDWIAVGDTTGAIEIWQVGEEATARRLEGHTGAVSALAVSADGALLASAGLDGRVILWETASGRLVREVAHLDRGVGSLGLSPDDARLVGGAEDGTVLVWDVATGHLVTTLSGHAGNVRAVAFSPSGDRIVSGGADQTVRIWSSVPPDARAAVEEIASRTNLRACRDGVTVVPVTLGPGVDRIWAPREACPDGGAPSESP
ncbi:MAG: protein kinase [Sandaracinus sp.]